MVLHIGFIKGGRCERGYRSEDYGNMDELMCYCFLSHRATTDPDITSPHKVIKPHDDCVPALQTGVRVHACV